MRFRLDNGKSYDLLAMYIPHYVGHQLAYEAMRMHFAAWKNAATLPLRSPPTLAGLIKWLIVLILHSLSLMFLPPLLILGVSMKAYTVFLSDKKQKMSQYQSDLKRIYAELADVEDPIEYQKRLKEEIAKVKPFE